MPQINNTSAVLINLIFFPHDLPQPLNKIVRKRIKMKSLVTLSTLLITLFINNVYAMSPESLACNNALNSGDVTAAIMQANKALGINNKDNDALLCQGRTLAAKGDIKSALASFRLAESQSSNAFDKAISNLLVGNAYKALKQHDNAMNSYQQTILNAKAANNLAFERLAHNAIGDANADKKDFSQALLAYTLASKLVANDNERADSFEKIALTYHNMNQNDLALEYQIKAYLMNETAGNLDQYAHSSIELGRYYAIEKKYTSAENVLNKIIKFAKEQGGAYFEAQGSYILAKVKVATGDIPAAKILIANAKLIAKNTNDKLLDEEIDQETKNLL